MRRNRKKLEVDNWSPNGLNLAMLLLESRDWMHRRVDSLRLDSEGITRRHVSLDFTLPEVLNIDGTKNRAIIPIALIPKGTVRRLNTLDCAGTALVVLGADDNKLLAREMVESLVPEFIFSDQNLRDEFDEHLHKIIESGPEQAEEISDCFKTWFSYSAAHSSSPRDEESLLVFEYIVQLLASHFLLLVELDKSFLGTRTIVKYSLDEDLSKIQEATRVTQLGYVISDYAFAYSQHFELQVPRGIGIRSLTLNEFDIDGSISKNPSDSPRRPRTIAHVTSKATSRLHSGYAVFEVVPMRQGIYTFGAVCVWAVSLLVGLGLTVRVIGSDVLLRGAEPPSPSVAILLLGPALIISWFSRTPEHELVMKLLKPLRISMVACVVSLILMAGMAALPLAPYLWHFGWVAVGVTQTLSVVVWCAFMFNFSWGRKKRGPDEALSTGLEM